MMHLVRKRIGPLAAVVVGTTVLAFWLPRLAGSDPCVDEKIPPGSPEHLACLERLGLDRPLMEQYLTYVSQLARGDFGTSILAKEPVLDLWWPQLAATLELASLALLFGVAVGIPAGMIAARKLGSAIDRLVLGIALTGYSMPIFWTGVLALMLFSGVLPQGNRIHSIFQPDLEEVTGLMLIDSLLSGQRGAFASAAAHLVLPTVILGTIPLAVVARQTRSAVLEVLHEDYVRTAHSKGLPPWRVMAVHVLRGALVPVVTTVGLQVSVLLGGAVLTEQVFARPGIGTWLIDAARARDYPTLQSGILLVSGMVTVVNLGVDLVCNLIDPRMSPRP